MDNETAFSQERQATPGRVKFAVHRTGQREIQPCKEARQETFTRIDERTWSRPEQFVPGGREGWLKDGQNHRIEGGHLKRDFPGMEGWFIELDSLEGLLAFADKYGEIIVGRNMFNPDIRDLEIYDTYRE